MDLLAEGVRFKSGSKMVVNSDAEESPSGRLMLILSSNTGGAHSWVEPAEARDLAALLLKHADRAEGKAS